MSENNEDPADRACKYIASFDDVLHRTAFVNQDSQVKASGVAMVSDTIKRYLNDARYYLENKRPATSLASIAYAEGLLDALKFLNLTKRKLED